MTRLDPYLLGNKGIIPAPMKSPEMPPNTSIEIKNQNQDINEILSNMNDEQTQQLLGILQTKQIQSLGKSIDLIQRNVSDLAKNQKQLESAITNKIDVMQANLHAAIDKNAYAHSIVFDDEYVNMRTLGRTYNPEMLNLFAKLMKWAGLVHFNYELKLHVPYERFIGSIAQKTVKVNKAGFEYIDYKWHKDKTKEFIDKRLKEAGLYEAFHNQKTKAERDAFLSTLI
jgi:mevalonate kinase